MGTVGSSFKFRIKLLYFCLGTMLIFNYVNNIEEILVSLFCSKWKKTLYFIWISETDTTLTMIIVITEYTYTYKLILTLHFTSMTATFDQERGRAKKARRDVFHRSLKHTQTHKPLIVSDGLFSHRCSLDNNNNCCCSFVCLCIAQRSLCYTGWQMSPLMSSYSNIVNRLSKNSVEKMAHSCFFSQHMFTHAHVETPVTN